MLGSISEKGPVRDLNEDAFLVLPKRGLYIVADGVGGDGSGRIASNFALERARAWPDFLGSGEGFLENAWKALQQLDQDLRQHAETLEIESRLATTLTALFWLGKGTGLLIHAGDSILFAITPEFGVVELTRAQTLAEELRAQGQTSIDPASEHTLVNCLGGLRRDMTQIERVDLAPFRYLLLCTDGIGKYLSHRDIADWLADPERKGTPDLTSLLRSARKAGSEDNMTAVLLGIE